MVAAKPGDGNCNCAFPARTSGSARRASSRITIGTPARCCRKFRWRAGREFIARNDEFLIVGAGANGQALVTHINPATGESRVEEIGQPGQTAVAQNAPGDGKRGIQPNAGLPLTPGTGADEPGESGGTGAKPFLPGRIALPALLANSSEQERSRRNSKTRIRRAPAHSRQPASRSRLKTKPVISRSSPARTATSSSPCGCWNRTSSRAKR